MDTDYIPIPSRARTDTGLDSFVLVDLREINRIREELAKMRHLSPAALHLHEQVTSFYDKLQLQLRSKNG